MNARHLLYGGLILLLALLPAAAEGERRSGQLIDTRLNEPSVEEQLVEMVREELTSTFSDQEDYRYTVTVKSLPRLLKQNADSVISVSYPRMDLPKGYTTFDVRWRSYDEEHSGKAQFFIRLKQYLPVANNRISKGQRLTPDMFTYRWVDATRLRGSILKNTDAVEGKVAAGFISEGRPLRPNDLGNIPVIEHGEHLAMTFVQDRIKITLKVTARSDAARNEELRVYCPDTRSTYLVKAIAPQQVEWIRTL